MASWNPVPTSSLPTLADYVRILWRRRFIVLAGLVAGVLLGLAVLPGMTSPTYQATQRITMLPLTASVMAPGATAQVGFTNTAPGAQQTDPSLVADLHAVQVAEHTMGPSVGQLSAVSGAPQALWPGLLASALSASTINGTNQVDISLTDPSPALASTFVHDYALAFVADRNAENTASTNAALANLQSEANGLQQQVLALAKQADAQTNPQTHSAPLPLTTTELNLATSDYQAKIANIEHLRNEEAFLSTPTAMVGQPTILQASTAAGPKTLLAVGLLAGAFVGLAAALLWDALRPRVHRAKDAGVASRSRVLGASPKTKGSGPLVVQDQPLGAAAEGYHGLRTALDRLGFGRSIRVLAVVSADAKEGRSTVVANLALTLARRGRQVIVVQGDLRSPGAADLLGIHDKGPGLAQLLEGRRGANPCELAHVMRDGIFVLPAGTSALAPSELLAVNPLRTVLNRLADEGAVVIVDTPAGRLSSDALVIATASDATIIVARAGHTRPAALTELARGLRHEGVEPLGVMVVGTTERETGAVYAPDEDLPASVPPAYDLTLPLRYDDGASPSTRSAKTEAMPRIVVEDLNIRQISNDHGEAAWRGI